MKPQLHCVNINMLLNETQCVLISKSNVSFWQKDPKYTQIHVHIAFSSFSKICCILHNSESLTNNLFHKWISINTYLRPSLLNQAVERILVRKTNECNVMHSFCYVLVTCKCITFQCTWPQAWSLPTLSEFRGAVTDNWK